MKKIKKFTLALAFVMLLSCGFSVAAMAASTTTSTSSVSGSISAVDQVIISDILKGNALKLANGDYLVSLSNSSVNHGNLTYVIITEAEYQYYLAYAIQNGLYIGYPTFPSTPSIPTVPTIPSNPSDNPYGIVSLTLTMEQFTSRSLGYGNASNYITYSSSDSNVVSVDANGTLTALSAGTATVVVRYSTSIRYIYQITVTPSTVNWSDYEIRVYTSSNLLEVGASVSVYAYLVKNGEPVVSSSLIPFSISVSNNSVLSVDGTKVTALSSGVADVIVTIPNTGLSGKATIYVKGSTSVTPPVIDTPQYPIIGGSAIIGGSIVGGIDTTKYDITYKVIYLNGRWQTVLVLVPKEEVKEDKPEEKPTTKPTTPEVTPDELEQLEKEVAEAERIALLKNKISLAMKGELEWYEVYTDMYEDSYYVPAVNYVLSNGLMTGKEDGTFGTTDTVRYSDVKKLLCNYLDVTEAEFDELGILEDVSDHMFITREELAQVFYNLAKHLDVLNSKRAYLAHYDDYGNLDKEYESAFAWAIANSIMNKTSTRITPEKTVNRARLAYMLYKFDQYAK